MSLFGGPKKISVYDRDQRELAKDITGTVGRQWGQAGPVYGEQIIPGASQLQNQTFDLASGYLGGISPAIQDTLAGKPSFTVDPATRQRYYESAVKAPAMQQFRDTLEGIDARYGNRWTSDSGAHRGSVNRAAGDLSTNLGGIMGDLVYRDEMAQRGAQESAANRRADAGFRGLGTIADLGATQRGIQAQQQGEDYYKWQQGQAYNNPWLQFMSSAMAPRYQIANDPGIMGQIGGFMGGAGGLMSGIGAL